MLPERELSTIHLDRLVREHPIDFTRLLYMLYNDMEQQLARSDQKAHIILSTNAILAAVIASFGFKDGLLDSMATAPAVVVISYCLFFGSLLLSVWYALMVSVPRMGIFSQKTNIGNNLFYSGYITSLDAEDYLDAFLAQPVQAVKEAVIVQIHAKAMIVQQKYQRVQKSTNFLMLAIIFLVLTQALQLII